jgi:hypothetical protein
MKITRSHLRRIIREELGIINEQPMDGPLRGDPSVIAYQHRPQAVKDSDARAAQAIDDMLSDLPGYKAVQDFVDTILDNPDTMNALSLGAKVVGAGLTLFPEPTTTAAGLSILKGSSAFDVAAAAGYASEGDRNETIFSVMSALLFANAKNAQQFYRSASKLRNNLRNLRNNPSIFYLLKKGTPSWAWAGAALTLEAVINAAEKVVEEIEDATSNIAQEDEEAVGTGIDDAAATALRGYSRAAVSQSLRSLRSFTVDAQEIKDTIEQISSAVKQ